MSTILDLLEDACARLPHTTRSMFGGHGLFAPNGGIFAAIVDEERIVLKFSDETARAELVGLGGKPWTYAGKMTMREWILVPHELYDDADSLATWAKRAHALAPAKKAKGKKATKARGTGSKGKTPPRRATRR